jgi:cytochrome b561
MRKVHFVISTLVLVAVVIQFYLAGLGVFGPRGADLFQWHSKVGRVVLPIVLLVAIGSAAIARNRTLRYALGLLGLLALQVALLFVGAAATGSDPDEGVVTPAGAAIMSLHVLNGLAVVWLAVVLVRRSYASAYPRRDDAPVADAAGGRVPARTP